MRLSSVTAAVLSIICGTSVAFAAANQEIPKRLHEVETQGQPQPQTQTPTTTPSPQDFNKMTAQQKLDFLQQQLDNIQLQLNNRSKVGVNARLSRYANINDSHGYSYFETDSTAPFDLLPDTTFIPNLLKERSDFAGHKVIFGGYFEFDPQVWDGSYRAPAGQTAYHSGSQISTTTAKFDVMAKLNAWTTMFFTGEANLTSSMSVSVERAFIVFGNLKRNPLFAAFGQFYLPFGVFGTGGPWTNSLTKTTFRPGTQDQLLFGYDFDGLNTNFALFNRGTGNGNATDFVYSFYKNDKLGKWSVNYGAGYIFDTRGDGSAIGSAYTSGTSNQLSGGRNPAFDLNLTIHYSVFGLAGEYNQAFHSANYGTTSTGIMRSWTVAGSYAPTLWNKVTLFALDYSQTHHMDNIPMGLSGHAVTAVNATEGFKRQIIASVSREIVHNIYLGPEFVYAWVNNSAGETWTGTLDVSAYF